MGGSSLTVVEHLSQWSCHSRPSGLFAIRSEQRISTSPVGESHTKMKHKLTHRLRQNSDTRTTPRPTLAIINTGQLRMNRRHIEWVMMRERTMTLRKILCSGGGGISAIHLREVNPLGRTGSPSLLGQVPGVVIEHRREVDHDKREPGECYLPP